MHYNFSKNLPSHYEDNCTNFNKPFNGMLHHPLGGAVIFLSLQHFIAPSLKLINALFVLLP